MGPFLTCLLGIDGRSNDLDGSFGLFVDEGSVEVDDPHAHGLEHRLGAVTGVELLVDRGEMVLDGLLREVEP